MSQSLGGLIISGYPVGSTFRMGWPHAITSVLFCHPQQPFHLGCLNNGRENQRCLVGYSRSYWSYPDSCYPFCFNASRSNFHLPAPASLPEDLLFFPWIQKHIQTNLLTDDWWEWMWASLPHGWDKSEGRFLEWFPEPFNGIKLQGPTMASNTPFIAALVFCLIPPLPNLGFLGSHSK